MTSTGPGRWTWCNTCFSFRSRLRSRTVVKRYSLYSSGLILLLIATIVPVVSYAQGAPSNQQSIVERLNAARSGRRVREQALSPLQHDAQLDQLADQYLGDMLQRRDLRLTAFADASKLIADISAALEMSGNAFQDVGIVVFYGSTELQALQGALGQPQNQPALFDPALTLAGSSTAKIPDGEPWFISAAGDPDQMIKLNGLTLVVLVTAGSVR